MPKGHFFVRIVKGLFIAHKKSCKFKFCNWHKNMEEIMLQTKLHIENIGEPNIDSLSNVEKNIFLDVALTRIIEVCRENNKNILQGESA